MLMKITSILILRNIIVHGPKADILFYLFKINKKMKSETKIKEEKRKKSKIIKEISKLRIQFAQNRPTKIRE